MKMGLESEREIDTSLVGGKKKWCESCHLPKIGSNEIRPDHGLRGCKCPDVSSYYKPAYSVENIQMVTKNSGTLHQKHFSDPRHGNTNVTTEDDCELDLRINESSHLEEKYKKVEEEEEEEESSKKNILIPPQGMDYGQYPKPLYYQYYPNRKKSYTYDVLPLPFLDRLNYEGMLTLSMNNVNVKKNWQEFIDNLPNSQFPSLTYPNEKFWRWKTYLRYKPDDEETENDYRYKMKVGPRYDDVGRLPITGEDLQLYRESRLIKFKPNSRKKYELKNGDVKMCK